MQKKFAVLAFRIVVLGPDRENVQELFSQINMRCSSIGVFSDFSATPYPKVQGASMVRIEFDVPLPFLNGIQTIVELLGGSGWHLVDKEYEKTAIWAEDDDLCRPLGDYFYWGEIQLIPFEQLSKSHRALQKNNFS